MRLIGALKALGFTALYVAVFFASVMVCELMAMLFYALNGHDVMGPSMPDALLDNALHIQAFASAACVPFFVLIIWVRKRRFREECQLGGATPISYVSAAVCGASLNILTIVAVDALSLDSVFKDSVRELELAFDGVPFIWMLAIV
ncbi:MAG: hypothetical protein FWE70_08475, partial [Oscillospiraceae bacterium]|nr:hypothetical protein [Oscillospiraceae bacterium]